MLLNNISSHHLIIIISSSVDDHHLIVRIILRSHLDLVSLIDGSDGGKAHFQIFQPSPACKHLANKNIKSRCQVNMLKLVKLF